MSIKSEHLVRSVNSSILKRGSIFEEFVFKLENCYTYFLDQSFSENILKDGLLILDEIPNWSTGYRYFMLKKMTQDCLLA